MRFHWGTLLLILFVGLTACGSEPEQVKLDRRFLNEAQLTEQLKGIKATLNGVVLDELVWTSGEDKVFTLLTREENASDRFGGIFLRHYKVGELKPELLWTYQDSISCQGGATGANLVKDHSPALRPTPWLEDEQDQFLLRYQLGCSVAADQVWNKTMVVIDARSGTPEIRLEAGRAAESVLKNVPNDKAAELRSLWEESVL
ncbi:MAG: hypothetical protein AAF840_10255 [Bacteroidota bacterium]